MSLSIGIGLAITRGQGVVVPAEPGEADLIIIIGQSNGDGRAAVSGQRAALTTFYGNAQPNLNVWYKPAVRSGSTVTAGSFADDGAWWQLHRTHDGANAKTHQTIGDAGSTVAVQSASYYGTEVELGYLSQQEASPVPLYVMKAAVGGARIETNWGITSPGSSSLWTWFKDYVYTPALAAMPGNIDIRRLLVFWMQGESDADASMTQAAYAVSLQNLVNRLNSELFRVPDKIIIGGLSAAYDTAAGDEIEAAQIAVASANGNVIYLPGDGKGVSAAYDANSGIHFTAAGIQAQAADIWGLAEAPALLNVAAFDHGESGTDLSSYTFTGKSISGDTAIIAVLQRKTGTGANVTAVSVNGVSSVKIASGTVGSGGEQELSYWFVTGVSGTTASIGVTLNTTTLRCGALIWSVPGATIAKCNAYFTGDAASRTTLAQNVSGVAGGVALATMSAISMAPLAWSKANSRLAATSVETTLEYGAADVEISATGTFDITATKTAGINNLIGVCTIAP